MLQNSPEFENMYVAETQRSNRQTMTMENPVRAMALYDWIEDFDLSKYPEFLAELVEDSGIKPTKAEFDVPNDKRRRRTIYKNTRLIEVISQFTSYSSFELCRPIEGNHLNLESDMQYAVRLGRKSYTLTLPPEKMPLTKLLNHVRVFCRHMTPRYGFSHVMDDPAATFFLSGVAATSLSYDNRKRADDLGQSLRSNGAREHLSGKLHDIYEFNVLSPTHLQRDTFGQTLTSWIMIGGRGELVEVNSKVFVWLVPEDVRNFIRPEFLKAGLLIASV
jgi:hypothetical protein